MKKETKTNTTNETTALLDEETIETEQMAEFPEELVMPENPFETFITEELKASHETEIDLFARHEGIPAHNQEILQKARITQIGSGGLGSYISLGLIKSGTGLMTVIDGDTVERHNLSRQFFYKEDLGKPKGIRLAKNLSHHAAGGATITGIGLRFEEAIEKVPLPAEIFVVGVDNNACRLKAVQEARRRRIPAVFTMLSGNGMRCQIFLQGASPLDPCLWCALPNLEPEKILPCASAIISSCFLASAFTIFFIHRALMGWGKIEPFNWREADLSGMTPDHKGTIRKREKCSVCGDL